MIANNLLYQANGFRMKHSVLYLRWIDGNNRFINKLDTVNLKDDLVSNITSQNFKQTMIPYIMRILLDILRTIGTFPYWVRSISSDATIGANR